MQSALIKKQLEDQKERFLKRQQLESSSSQSSDKSKAPAASVANSSTTSTPTPGKVAPAFLPTSVIRKMACEKAEEEKAKRTPPSQPATTNEGMRDTPR